MVAVALATALVVKLAVVAVELAVAVQNVPSVGKALWSLFGKRDHGPERALGR